MIRIFLFVIFLGSLTNAHAIQDSLDIKIGQMLMVGMSGTSVDSSSSIIQDIKAGMVGGILLFEYNLDREQTATKLSTLCTQLKQASTIPLFISIDQEGGQVNRLKEKYGFPPMPSAYSVAQRHDSVYAAEVAETIAATVCSVGINLNYAPVLDVYNPLCPVLGKRNRCFSNRTDSIAFFAGIVINAHHRHKLYTALKHFPGHGNSLADSHLGLVDVTRYWKEEELAPYRILINDSLADIIMTAHIVNQKLDSSGKPATLSKVVITDILRDKLQYKGVVITDDMQMHAISKQYGLDESIRMAILAGVDIVMFSNNIQGANNYIPSNLHATIKRLVLNGDIPMQRIQESYDRIMRLKLKN